MRLLRPGLRALWILGLPSCCIGVLLKHILIELLLAISNVNVLVHHVRLHRTLRILIWLEILDEYMTQKSRRRSLLILLSLRGILYPFYLKFVIDDDSVFCFSGWKPVLHCLRACSGPHWR